MLDTCGPAQLSRGGTAKDMDTGKNVAVRKMTCESDGGLHTWRILLTERGCELQVNPFVSELTVVHAEAADEEEDVDEEEDEADARAEAEDATEADAVAAAKPKKKSAKEVTANKAAAKAAPASPGKPASKRKRQAR